MKHSAFIFLVIALAACEDEITRNIPDSTGNLILLKKLIQIILKLQCYKNWRMLLQNLAKEHRATRVFRG